MSQNTFIGHQYILIVLKLTNPSLQRGVYSHDEIGEMFQVADDFERVYFQLRAKAIVSVFITGKRRLEVSSVRRKNVKVEEDYLHIVFQVAKKRRKKIQPMRTKRFPATSVFAQHIINYLNWMDKHHPECEYLFPSIRSVFGRFLSFSKDRHISGRQVLRIVKQLNESGWCHLFRDTRAAEIIKADEKKYGEAKLLTVYKVKHSLNLEREATAWNYINRYATETVEFEEDFE